MLVYTHVGIVCNRAIADNRIVRWVLQLDPVINGAIFTIIKYHAVFYGCGRIEAEYAVFSIVGNDAVIDGQVLAAAGMVNTIIGIVFDNTPIDSQVAVSAVNPPLTIFLNHTPFNSKVNYHRASSVAS